MDEESYLEIILGSYEEFLLGYKYYLKSQEIKQTFATHSHSSSIRSVCVSSNYLATGGADDRIFVYDLKQRKEHCVLTHHDSTVNCLAFTPGNTHLLSGSADGMLTIVRVGNWQLEKIWKGTHKGLSILDIAVHFSGKLALTLGADHTLCTWNLVKGRQAYIINLNSKSKDPKSLDRIAWAPCGVRFILSGGKYTELWSIEKGGMLNAIEHANKVTSCCWISNNSLLVGYENGELAVTNTESGKIKSYSGHKSRVKAVTTFNEIIVTAASDGNIKIWDKNMKKLQEHDSGCRITCLCLALPILEDMKKSSVKIEKEESESTSEEEECDSKITDSHRNEESSSEEEIIIVPKKKVKKQKAHR